MTIREFYTAIGGNYDEVLGRLQREELVCRFVKRFLTDSTYENLAAARKNNDIAAAFRAAHTLKGIAASLGFDDLMASSSALTEKLRPQTAFPGNEYFEAVGREYSSVITAAGQLED